VDKGDVTAAGAEEKLTALHGIWVYGLNNLKSARPILLIRCTDMKGAQLYALNTATPNFHPLLGCVYAQFIGVGSDKDQLLRIWTGVQVGARLSP
jgi:hypothetical protein